MVRIQKYAKPGQPTRYNEETLEKAYQYLNECREQEDIYEVEEEGENGEKIVRRYGSSGKVSMPNAGGLAIHLQVHRDTLYEWAEKHEDFAYFMNLMNAIRESRLHEGGLSGRYSSTITAIMLGKYGYHKVVDNRSSDGSMSPKAPMNDLTEEQLRALADAEVAKNAAAQNNT